MRYSELDWLRVILIFAVFLHHVFMPFNGDGWHVMNGESSKVLDDIMVYFEQIRLQVLFFIAGAGSLLLLNKVDSVSFLKSKLHRLLVPLLVGMIFIVPPQNYFENISEYKNFTDAYTQLMWSFDNNHLWFIEYLIVFMVLASPLYKLIKSPFGLGLQQKLDTLSASKYGLAGLALPLIVIRLVTKAYFPENNNQIENLSVSLYFFYFFIVGMFFINSRDVWVNLVNHRLIHLKLLILVSVLFYSYYYSPDLSDYASLFVRWQIWWLLCTLVSWAGLLTIVGYAIHLCKTTPKWLKAINELIYPFYIFHQTIIVCFAYYIVQWELGIAFKSITLLVSSLLVTSAICFWLIKPIKPMRYLFGLKPTKLNDEK